MQRNILLQRQQSDREDGELVKKIQRGDQRALASLYDRYAGVLYPFSLRVTGAREAAEDVVQDVFVHVWGKAGSYAPQSGSVYAWMTAVCRMKSLDKVRSTSQKKQGQEMKGVPHQSSQEGEQKSAQPETIIAMKGFTEAARNSLRSLSKLELRLLELSYYEGQSQSDLARMLRIPLGTIKGKMRRGIQKLRQVLAEEAV